MEASRLLWGRRKKKRLEGFRDKRRISPALEAKQEKSCVGGRRRRRGQERDEKSKFGSPLKERGVFIRGLSYDVLLHCTIQRRGKYLTLFFGLFPLRFSVSFSGLDLGGIFAAEWKRTKALCFRAKRKKAIMIRRRCCKKRILLPARKNFPPNITGKKEEGGETNIWPRHQRVHFVSRHGERGKNYNSFLACERP